MKRRLIVGTRTSTLARRQAELVVAALRDRSPDCTFAVHAIPSIGDREPDAPLTQLGRGAFVSEMERALREHRIDLAVHSLKDLPTEETGDLVLVPVLERGEPRDVLVDRWDLPLRELPSGARLGTSSPRREMQLRAARPDLVFLPIRGNVDTRLTKSRGGDYDGAILAAAGMERLGLGGQIADYLDPHTCTPAPGQGVLAVQMRKGEDAIVEMAMAIQDGPTAKAVVAERQVLRASNSGCHAAVGALAMVDGESLQVVAAIAGPGAEAVYRTTITGSVSDPAGAGQSAFESLIAQGASSALGGGR